MKRVLAVWMVAMMLIAPMAAAEGKTGQASSMGFGGVVEVTLTVDEGKIVDVKAVGEKETQGIGSVALETLPGKMIEANSIEVDGVAGATVSSTAILTAAKGALDQIGGVSEAETKMKPGTYSSEAKGFYSDIRADVTVSEDEILSVEVNNTAVFENTSTNTAKDGIATENFNDGTLGFGSVANVEFPKRIVESQSVACDGISGATASTAAIRKAVTEALMQAGAPAKFFAVPERPEKTDETLTTDVLVVGSGIAGFGAATAALESGADVLMIEKLSIYGGTTISSGAAMMAAAGPDNPETTAKDLADFWQMRAEGKGNYDQWLFVAEKSGESIQYLMDMGIEFKLGSVPASDIDRSYRPKAGMAYTVMTTLKKYFDEKGGELLLETKATELLTNEKGEVIGVVAEGKDKNYKIYATGGVVLATGGFEHDQEMVEKYAPHYAKNRSFGGNAGDDGDAIKLCQQVGADFAFPGYGMDDSGYAVVVVDPIIKNGGGVQYIGYTTVQVDGYTGKRFHNERSNFETAEMDDTGHFNDIWAIFDSTRPADILEQLDTAVENGYAHKADTFEELAEKVGMPVEDFVATMNRWNEMAASGVDTEFGNPTIADAPVLKAPFYAGSYQQNMIGTFGGPKINTDAEVLRPDGTSIPGLYAAGECANGEFFYRLYTCGGSSVMMGFVFGREAGANAAARVAK